MARSRKVRRKKAKRHKNAISKRRGHKKKNKKTHYTAAYVKRLKRQLDDCRVQIKLPAALADCSAVQAELDEKKSFIARESKRAKKRILELTRALNESTRAHAFLVEQVTNLGKDIDTVVHQRNRFEAQFQDLEIASRKERKALKTKIGKLDNELAGYRTEIDDLRKANRALTEAKVALASELKKFRSTSFIKRLVGNLKGLIGNRDSTEIPKRKIEAWKKKGKDVDEVLVLAKKPAIAAAKRCRKKRKRRR